MLKNISIDNFILFEKSELSLKSGLNVITGETGSGKSLLLDAICFVLGLGKAANFVGKAKDVCNVTLTFSLGTHGKEIKQILKEFDIELSDEINLRRSYSKEAKTSKYFIEGTLVSANIAKKILTKIIDYTAQHENNRLLEKEYQLKFYDQIIGVQKLAKTFFEAYQEYQKYQTELGDLKIKEESSKLRKEYIEYQLKEFETVQPKENEDKEISEKIKNIQDRAKQTESLSELQDFLFGDAGISFKLKKLSRDFSGFDNISAILSDVNQKISSLDLEISKNFNGSEDDLTELESRRDELFRLITKHGRTLEKALEIKSSFETEIFEMAKIPDRISELVQKSALLEKELKKVGKELSLKRKEQIKSLEKKVNDVLKKLEMETAKFSINLMETAMTPWGFETVSFYINTTGEMKPLAEIASGGELSRVMLALKSLYSDRDVSVFVFDEIDNALGGLAAMAVGKKLQELSRNSQVLCITHHPQVASFADVHILVQRTKKDTAEIGLLKKDDRVKEISRMLGGKRDPSSAIVRAAKDLLENANTH